MKHFFIVVTEAGSKHIEKAKKEIEKALLVACAGAGAGVDVCHEAVERIVVRCKWLPAGPRRPWWRRSGHLGGVAARVTVATSY